MAQFKITIDDRKLMELIKNTGGGVTRYIIADGVEYGIYNEMGTVKMAAQPFMRPAVESVRPGFVAAFKNQLTNKQADAVLSKAAHDIERRAKELARVDTGAMRASIHVVKGESYVSSFEKMSHGEIIK